MNEDTRVPLMGDDLETPLDDPLDEGEGEDE